MIKSYLKRIIRPLQVHRSLLKWASAMDNSSAAQRKIVCDYKQLYKSKGLTTDEYYQFEFEKRDEEFRKSFLGLNEQRFYLDYLNPVKYYSLARNKYLAHKMLEDTGVRKSELYCYYQPEARFISSNEKASDREGVLRILKNKKVQSCVIKTTESSHGDNVWVINAIEFRDDDAVMMRFDGESLLLSSILGKEALIFESVVKQTKQFAAFNESSVNTVRFMTTLYPDGSARVIATFIKIGRAGKCVDNAGGGGNVDVCVDTETGEVKYAIQYDGWRNIKEIEKHPDSGNQLNGVMIENWQAIKEEVRKFQQAFPYCKAAGWDIAITDDGPVVIEVNDFWDRTGQYFIRRGWRNEIRDCYLAWRRFWDSVDLQGGVKHYATGNWRLPLKDKKMISKFS
ncbi:MAG: hypothetical protein II817_12300 [Bacteroidales bacterium]|nr:hypothetical protein [Bacteroidales bacterium]